MQCKERGLGMICIVFSEYSLQGSAHRMVALFEPLLPRLLVQFNQFQPLATAAVCSVWLRPRGDNAPLCNHPNHHHQQPQPTLLKLPPRKSRGSNQPINKIEIVQQTGKKTMSRMLSGKKQSCKMLDLSKKMQTLSPVTVSIVRCQVSDFM